MAAAAAEGKSEDAASPSRSYCCAEAVVGALKTVATWALYGDVVN